jgi:NADH-quinone oxidoreductase subunit F
MLEIVTDISEGRGKPEQIPLLEELVETVQETSLCALGKTAPNPVISTLRYFREEYLAHIREKRCPAGVCRELIAYVIDGAKCTGCGACLRACPYGAITGAKKEPHVIDLPACKKCGICSDGCKFEAITISSGGVPCYSM